MFNSVEEEEIQLQIVSFDGEIHDVRKSPVMPET